MKFDSTTQNLSKIKSDCILIGLFEEQNVNSLSKGLNKTSLAQLRKILAKGDIWTKTGQNLLVHDPAGLHASRLMLINFGKKDELSTLKYLSILRSTLQAVNKLNCKQIHSCLHDISVPGRNKQWCVLQAQLIVQDVLYEYHQKKEVALKKISFVTNSNRPIKELQFGQAIANGMTLAKDLGNAPGNICTPTYLAKEARKLANKHKKLAINVLNEKQMEKLGMNSLLSVSHGSAQPAKLIVLQYHGAKRSEAPIALVGKGITFDSGGISIKPGRAMDEMKFDMCGAASVLGTIQAAAQLNMPLNIIGIIAASENLPSSTATKPGDVVTSMSGKTIEILNTDAEGRLVLCDALTYTERFKPRLVIDIATLTGAMVVSLGKYMCGVFSNDEKLAQEIVSSSEEINDRAWHMPMEDLYQSELDSNFADIANIGGMYGGSITAACFLSRFTENFRWAHLDIAGVAWHSGKQKGSTGRPVPLLVQFLRNQY